MCEKMRGPEPVAFDREAFEKRFSGENGELALLLARCGHHARHAGGWNFGKGRVLGLLAEKETISQGELLDERGIKAGSLSGLLAAMEEKGLITRQKDEEDRRRSVLTVTEEGKKAAAEKEEPKDMFGCLTAEEKEQLTAILTKLRNQWDSEMKALQSAPRGHFGPGRGRKMPPHQRMPRPDARKAILYGGKLPAPEENE